MRDTRLLNLAAEQFNRFSYGQLVELGFTDRTIRRRLAAGQFVREHNGVFALAPLLEHDEWGKWMGATLTAPESVLSHISAAAAYECWSFDRLFETVTRPGSGGPRKFGALRVYRSTVLDEDRTVREGIPITTIERTILDLARGVSRRALARMVREAVRLELTSIGAIAQAQGRHHRRRGSRQVGQVIARYTGLPLERARSGAEVRAMELLRDHSRPLARLNAVIAGEEADLSWSNLRLIIEIDGGPFHLDRGEDAKKQARWEAAGWTVRRVPSDHVYDRPQDFLAQAPSVERPKP